MADLTRLSRSGVLRVRALASDGMHQLDHDAERDVWNYLQAIRVECGIELTVRDTGAKALASLLDLDPDEHYQVVRDEVDAVRINR